MTHPEQYSRQAFDEADRKAKLKTAAKEEQMRALEKGTALAKAPQIIGLLENWKQADMQQMEKLYGLGQKEAAAINEQYDRLVARVDESLQELLAFRKDKLGAEE